MKKRLMLPAMAFVFAIGLSFATERSTADAQNDYILVDPENEIFQAIPEVDCGANLGEDCIVRLPDEREFTVYDSENMGDVKKGDGEIKTL